MALPLSNTFQTGLADETAITVANSDDGGAGDAFTSIVTSGSATMVYDDDRAPIQGTLSLRCDSANAANFTGVEWAESAHGEVTEQYGRVYIYRTAVPTDTQYLCRFESGAEVCALIGFYLDGNLYTYLVGFSSPAGPAEDLLLNEWVRIEWHLISHPTTGSIHVKQFQGNSTTPYSDYNRTNVNTGTNFHTFTCGQGASSDGNPPFWISHLAVAADDWLGPAVELQTFYYPRRKFVGRVR